jgi:hypothetical protein
VLPSIILLLQKLFYTLDFVNKIEVSNTKMPLVKKHIGSYEDLTTEDFKKKGMEILQKPLDGGSEKSAKDVLLPVLEPHGLHVLHYGKGVCHLVTKLLLQMLQILMKLSGHLTEKTHLQAKAFVVGIAFYEMLPHRKSNGFYCQGR